MKKTSVLWFAILLFAGVSCHKNDDATSLSLRWATDSDSLSLSPDAQSLDMMIEGHGAWICLSDRSWCKVTPPEGSGSGNIVISLSANNTQKARSVTLRLSSPDSTLCDSLILMQQSLVPDSTTQYQLPVIFHVLYQSSTNKKQYVREGHLSTVLDRVNELYRHCGQDLGIQFYMAEEDPEGNLLEEPGVERVKINLKSINSVAFMGYGNEPKKYKSYMWDPNRYINIFIYTFESIGVQGISHLPYLLKPDAMEGLTTLEYEDWDEVPWPQCVSINNEFIYSYEDPDTPAIIDVTKTIAHELGHFLGLRHVFSEDPLTGDKDVCYDSDFCDDTPTYNKACYDKIMQSYPVYDDEAMALLLMRENCETGEEYLSTNIMDYACGYMNQFTADQARRMRYVVMHSPYIPGPKIRQTEQLSATREGKTNHYVLTIAE